MDEARKQRQAHVHCLLKQSYRQNPMFSHEQVLVLAEHLRKTYPDFLRYSFYHIVVGSTPTDACDLDDFPQDEVRLFVESLASRTAEKCSS